MAVFIFLDQSNLMAASNNFLQYLVATWLTKNGITWPWHLWLITMHSALCPRQKILTCARDVKFNILANSDLICLYSPRLMILKFHLILLPNEMIAAGYVQVHHVRYKVLLHWQFYESTDIILVICYLMPQDYKYWIAPYCNSPVHCRFSFIWEQSSLTCVWLLSIK